jgi:L-histidine N-alpha-methyltransferase
MRRPSTVSDSRRELLPGPDAVGVARIVQLDRNGIALRELAGGLAGRPREIACKYFYDDAGSALFERIMALPEYFPTRTERALLRTMSRSIVEAAGGAQLTDVVELGSGAASKTVALLDAALEAGGKPRYVGVDISSHALGRTREILAEARPEVPVVEVLADYSQPFELPQKPAGGKRLVLFLGGTIGNDEDESAIGLLSRVREDLEPGDMLLLGANLVTEPDAIHAAYNDSQGVTAAFNKNLLNAVNALSGASFRPELFDHYAPYVVEKKRIEMWLVAREAMHVDLGRIGCVLPLLQGEGIRTEISRRFVRDDVLRMIDAAGFSPEQWMASPDGRFGLALGAARRDLRGL